MRGRRGPKSKVGPEIHELCFELWADQGRSHTWIAEHLFHTKGIANCDDPSRPVCTSTVTRWIRKSHKQLKRDNTHRRDLEETVTGRQLDQLKEKVLHELLESREQMSFDERFRLGELWLRYIKERSATYGVYAPRRREVALTHTGGVEFTGLDPETEGMLAALEDQVQQARQARRPS